MRLYYVAGAFSAKTRAGVEANIRAAEELGIRAAKLGLYPVIPHCNTSHPAFELVQPYPFWIEGTLALLMRCDALITVPGWENSSGARGEVAWARGETGPWLVQVFYRIKRALTGVGRIPVFHHLLGATEWDACS